MKELILPKVTLKDHGFPRLTVFREREAILLQWVYQFMKSPKNTTIQKDGIKWHWISYRKVCLDLPKYFRTTLQVVDSFQRLCGLVRIQNNKHESKLILPGDLIYLERMIMKTNKGTQIFYRPTQSKASNSRIIVRDIEEESLKDNSKPNQASIAGPAFDILKEIMEIPNFTHDGPLFTTRFSGSPTNYSKTILQAFKHIHEIHNGKFLFKRKPSDWFLQIYDVTWEEICEVFDKVKGDWVAVKSLVMKMIRNYRKCWDTEKVPFSKKKLTKSITEFFFKLAGPTAISHAMVMAVRPPDNITESMADSVYNSLPRVIQELGEQYNYPPLNQLNYWMSLKSVYLWYKENKDSLIRKDTNFLYWFGKLSDWFQGYLEFISELTHGIPNNKNFGVNNPTWNLFVGKACKTHNINKKYFLNIP